MRRIGPTLLVVGVLLLVFGLGLTAAPAALALTPTASPELPDRPTLTPVAPTSTPEATPTAELPRDEPRRPQPLGRITGTVIDLTSGAPAPGIPVSVGGVVVTSDGNGNYDRPGLPAGSYVVELQLAPGRGEAAQGPLTVVLPAGGTTVQHLAFRSPAQVTATPTVALAPTEVAPTAAVPTATEAAPAATAAPTAGEPRPSTLPRTAGSGAEGALFLGVALILAGLSLMLAGRPRW